MNLRILLPAAALLGIAPSLHAGGPAGLEQFSFLIGSWRATGSGTPGEGSGAAEFLPGLSGRIITRKSFAEYPASPGKPAYRHEDFIVIAVEADSTIRADYFDNEGHVIRYTVSSPAPGKAVFLSPASRTSPRYRLTYRLGTGGTLDGRFEVAPPGGEEKFTTYLAWSSHRETPGPAPER
jgi:hypothetical protein